MSEAPRVLRPCPRPQRCRACGGVRACGVRGSVRVEMSVCVCGGVRVEVSARMYGGVRACGVGVRVDVCV